MLIQFMILMLAVGHLHCEDVEPTLQYEHGDSKIFVFDNVLHPRFGEALQSLLAANQSYSYFYPDPYSNPDRKTRDGNLHWGASVSPQLMIKTKIWAGIRRSLKSLPTELTGGKRYLPYFAQSTMLRRGDHTIAFQGDASRTDSIFVRVFLTSNMKKNVYADQAFYDENDEIITSIHPKPQRIIIWTGSVSTLMRPPSMEFEQAEFSLFLKLNPNKDLYHEAVKQHNDHLKDSEEHAKMPLPFTNHVNKFKLDKLNLDEHLVGKYFDKEGNMVAFFDDILPKELLDDLRAYVTNYHRGFSYNPYDPDTTEQHDNVNWIIQYKIEKLLNTPYWEAVKVLSEYMSNNTVKWYPYDVSTNLIQHTHHTRIHIDCVHEEYEMTFLLYLNPNWDENKYAETSFYDYASSKRPDEGMEMNEAYDFLAAAVPKFGRIAIFRNLIPHSARPSSPNFLAARYTFPVKVSQSHLHAHAKMLSESLDYKSEDTPDHSLYEPLKNGNYDPVLSEEKLEWVKEHHKIMMDGRERGRLETLKSFEALLIPERLRKS